MAGERQARLGDRIRVILAERLEKGLRDPRLGFVTITDVRVSGDSQQATIFYTVLGSPEDQEAQLASTAAALESAKGLLRSEVGKQLGMRHVPTLTFIADALPETARHLEEVLARAKAQDEAVAAIRREEYAGEPDPYKKPRAHGDEDDELGEDDEHGTGGLGTPLDERDEQA